ncbi:hypothetical protein CNR22_05320 [Sphingobacteriaceae bacterium]|nr:hypothetical protein CNR22_05320 [Sphingobacteriaceae bacterium]
MVNLFHNTPDNGAIRSKFKGKKVPLPLKLSYLIDLQYVILLIKKLIFINISFFLSKIFFLLQELKSEN